MSSDLILCATSRLAQTLRGQAPPGAEVWQTPNALTLGQWLDALADEALVAGLAVLPQALPPHAERLLWESAIAASLTEAAALFDVSGMAATAAEAHALGRAWNLQPAGPLLADEVRRFAAWQQDFLQRCAAGGWLDAAGVQQKVVALIEAGHFELPARIALAGFDRPTPLEQRLFDALAVRGSALEILDLAAVDRAEVQVFACADRAAECAAVAAWAEQQLRANPAVRLGVVAPDLAAVRDPLARCLDERLHPALIRPDGGELPRCYNISLGQPLTELPLVRVALELLALGSSRGRVEQARFAGALLAGGWSAALGEADGRAWLAAALRRELPYFTALPAVLRLAERHEAAGAPACPQSVAALAALAGVLAEAGGRRRPSGWRVLFGEALQAAGWPGDRPLSSPEYQAWRAFGELLETFAGLDAWLGQLGLSEALRRLRELARGRLFQPETRGRPAIQILGTLESAGLCFDALWVMGMNDDRWPPAPSPNPLLPIEAQRAAGAARASAEVELDFARRVHARLLRAAPRVHFSCALADGNRMLRASPLLAPWPARVWREQGGASALPGVLQQLAGRAGEAMERLDDAQAPPVAPGEKVSGGSGLLRAQAICPAWAYFQYRLGAEAMETPVEGLDPAARGTLVHAALEAFWRATASLQRLQALGEAARLAAIAAAVEHALCEFETERRQDLPGRFRRLEAARLQQLLGGWLDLEARRGQGFEVIACEAPAELEIEGIRVKLVVDRIDRLDDGRQVILDYKTGRAIDIHNWASDRLSEPQLPIYAALVAETPVSAVVFAKVRLDKPAFSGVADERDLLPGVQGLGDEKQKIFPHQRFPDWEGLVAHWRERLHAVAREVGEGRAGVVFADAGDLQYCEVLPLLRLPERQRLLAEVAPQDG